MPVKHELGGQLRGGHPAQRWQEWQQQVTQHTGGQWSGSSLHVVHDRRQRLQAGGSETGADGAELQQAAHHHRRRHQAIVQVPHDAQHLQHLYFLHFNVAAAGFGKLRERRTKHGDVNNTRGNGTNSLRTTEAKGTA